MNHVDKTAIIGVNVVMGDNNYIGPYCIIGFPAEHKEFWGKINGRVVIGNNNVFTGLVTIDAGLDITIIQDNIWMLKHSHVGHDAIIRSGVVISCGAKVGGHCEIGEETNIGLNATIHQRVIVPNNCMIGANAFVGKKTELNPFRKYAGVPAKDIGANTPK